MTGPVGNEQTSRPFSIVDELCTYHDAPAEPNNVHLEVLLSGHLDAALLGAATGAALASPQHANVRRAARGRMARRFLWEFPAEPDVDPVSLTSWTGKADLDRERERFLSCAPPLDAAPPFRLLLATGPAGDCLILNAHHAAFDGLGCLSLLGSIAQRYSAMAPASASTASSGRPDSAAGDVPDPAAAPDNPVPPSLAPSRLHGAATRIAPDPGHGNLDGYGYLLMPTIEVAVLDTARSRYGATVNDLLLSALAMAIARWNSAHGRPAGAIRITMPISDSLSPAALVGNRSRLAAITVVAADQGGADLARQVVSQTRLAKASPGPQVTAVSRALTAPALPVAAKRWLLRSSLKAAGRLVVDTSLVTNLGHLAAPPRFESVIATRMAFSTSAHMPRGLSVGAIALDRILHLCFRYRKALFSENAAQQFAGYFSVALNELTTL